MEAREAIRAQALELGFEAAGFARAPGPDEPFAEGERFRDWLARGHGASMGYLARTAARRADPRAVMARVRSVVALASAHPAAAPEPRPGEARVARYARGRDYHNVVLRRLRRLGRTLKERFPGEDFRWFVDTGAVLEKAWAVRAGLGWLGKNTLVLHPERGSYRLLGIVLTSLELAPDAPLPDLCGECRLCLDACPTGAFPEPYLLDARRCLSYLTIEHAGDFPVELRPALGDRLFGCDVCQEVCPWNLRPVPVVDPELGPPDAPLHEGIAELLALDEERFRALAAGRALRRPRREGLVRNACIAAGNSGDRGHVPALAARLADPSPVVRRHAAWALGELGGPDAERALGAALAEGGEADDAATREALAAARDRARAGGRGVSPPRAAP